MQIYHKVYQTQKCFFEKGAVFRIICAENYEDDSFFASFFICKSYTCSVYVREVIQSC